MLKFILISFLFILAVLGISLIVFTKSEKLKELQKELKPAYSVMTVKNCEDSIEGVIRSLAWQMSNDSCIARELVVIDQGSEDRTFFILKQLAKEYPFMHPMQKAEYINFIKEL